MRFCAQLARRLAFAAASFVGITLVTFGLLHFASPAIRVDDPRALLDAKERYAKLVERYALDRPLFWNPAPPDARELAGKALAPVDGARLDAWLSAAREEAKGRGTDQTRATLEESSRALAPSGRALVPELLPRLLRANVLVLGRGLELLHDAAGVPAFPRPQGESRRMLTPDEVRLNESLRRSAGLWWRRHENEFRERSNFWRSTVGKVTETRYGAWLGDLVRLDLGDSLKIRPEAPVTELIAERLPLTAVLMVLATLVLFAVGVPLGLFAAATRGRAFDRISQGVLFVLHATPEFWVATMAQIWLATEGHWRIFPVGDLLSPAVAESVRSGAASAFSPKVLVDAAHHLVLPVLVLVFPAWVVVARHVRAAGIEALGSRFVTAARARGLTRRRILLVHVLRSCAAPVITLFTSVLPGLVTGSILVEVLFSLEGMGRLSCDAALERDFPVGMGILTLVAIVMVLAHVLTDVLHALVDPRVRTA